MKYTSIIQNGGSTMEDDSRPFFNSEVIMTSLLLLKIINVFVNFLILTDAFLFKYFNYCFEGKNWWNLDFANKFNNMTS